MIIKVGDTVKAAVGVLVDDWKVLDIINDGKTTWLKIEATNGYTTTITADSMKNAIETGVQTHLNEIDL